MPLVRRRPLAGLAALGAAALIAGCGGGAPTRRAPTSSASRPTPSARTPTRASTRSPSRPPADQVLPLPPGGAADPGRGAASRIGALDPPDDLQAAFDEATDLLTSSARTRSSRRPTASRPARTRRRSSQEVEPGDRRACSERGRAKAHELGLTVCGADDDGDGHRRRTATTAPATTTGTAGGGATGAAPARPPSYVEDVQRGGGARSRSFSQPPAGHHEPRGPAGQGARGRRPSSTPSTRRIAKLEGYTLDNATLEAQRAGLGRDRPEVERRAAALPRRRRARRRRGRPGRSCPRSTQAISRSSRRPPRRRP